MPIVSEAHSLPVMLTNEQFTELASNMRRDVDNMFTLRREFLTLFADKHRNIESECGYPRIEELTATEYKHLYDAFCIAARVVDLEPLESWKVNPCVYETEDVDEITEFEQAWEDLGKSLVDNELYEGEEANPIWEYLKRADVLSGIGHYGVILLGFDDGKPLSEPVVLKDIKPKAISKGAKKDQPREAGADSDKVAPPKRQQPLSADPPTPEQPERSDDYQLEPDDAPPKVSEPVRPEVETERKLLYIRVLDETQARIASFVRDHNDRRYGLPELYTITINESSNTYIPEGGDGTQTETSRTESVHWTRIIHVADNLQSNECIGTPRMQQLYHRLYDLFKLYGGSAEMYWQGAFPGLSFETHHELGGDVDINVPAVRDQYEQWRSGLQRAFMIPGLGVKTIAPQVVDPTPQIDTQIEAICIKKGCPKRVFTGSERGELASSQDRDSWNERVIERQNRYCTPSLIIPFINRLIRAGALPVPEQYYCSWNPITSLSASEKADVMLKRTQAYAAYIAGEVDALIDPKDYLMREGGFSEKEAQAIIKNKMEALESEEGLDLHAREDEMAQQQMEMQQEQFEASREDGAADRDAKIGIEEQKLKMAQRMKAFSRNSLADNEFCPTGEGGGIDPTCSPNDRGKQDDSKYSGKYQQTMSGEYWLEDGTSMFADGDIGDMNHEGYAIDRAMRNVIDAAGGEYYTFAEDEFVDWDGFVAKLEEDNDMSKDGMSDDKLKELGIDPEEFSIASGNGDARSYAVEKYGWTRVADNNVQTGSLTKSDMTALADGLADAMGGMVGDDDASIERQSFNIETKTAYYNEVPWPLLEAGDVGALREYKQHGTPGWGGTTNRKRRILATIASLLTMFK